MAFTTLLVAFVASIALQASAAPQQSCSPNPCSGIFCIATHRPTVVPSLQPGGCSTCQCVLIPVNPTSKRQACAENPCEDIFCIATTNPTIIPGLGPGDCSTCECVPIGA
ncbi:hypothetical protein BKA70DRAFT_1435996 [Coprinopsis sp. MPI-PUGE-AT-0042]|nr:hypothetical protein BKA70DRAFT_1435996 [Coprinopsis sp. MPI-PUGE-AT-0042]